MQHWYVYHSRPTMGCDYASLNEAAAYSKKNQPKLLLGHVIWIVEGPSEFYLVDCFLHAATEYAPLRHPFSEYELKAQGRSLINAPIPLSRSLPWFHNLHAKYITKRRFFDRVDGLIVDGLTKISGVSL